MQKGEITIKQLLCFGLAAVLFAALFSHFSVSAAPPSEIFSDAYCVMDASTGQILIEKNGDKREYPASITKVLTLALALENGDMGATITVQEEDVITDYSTSHIALQAGEQLSVRDAVEATILMSANDAANCLAQYRSGSIQSFVQLMNEKAASLGADSSHFTNTNGLPDDDHYTTANDMARITRWAMTVPAFGEIFDDTEYTMGPTNKQTDARLFGTSNLMVVQSKYYYDGVLGGKLGWTEEAGHTMVTVAERDGRRLICVVMNSEHKYEKYKDAHALLDYCFDEFQPVTVLGEELPKAQVPIQLSGGDEENVLVAPAQSYTFLLHQDLDRSDVLSHYDLPESYTPGDSFSPTVTFTLNSSAGLMNTDLGVYPLEYEIPQSPALGQPDQPVPISEPEEKTPASHLWWKAAACLLILFTAAFLRAEQEARMRRARKRR